MAFSSWFFRFVLSVVVCSLGVDRPSVQRTVWAIHVDVLEDLNHLDSWETFLVHLDEWISPNEQESNKDVVAGWPSEDSIVRSLIEGRESMDDQKHRFDASYSQAPANENQSERSVLVEADVNNNRLSDDAAQKTAFLPQKRPREWDSPTVWSNEQRKDALLTSTTIYADALLDSSLLRDLPEDSLRKTTTHSSPNEAGIGLFSVEEIMPFFGHRHLYLPPKTRSTMCGLCTYHGSKKIDLPSTTALKAIVPFLSLGPNRLSKMQSMTFTFSVSWKNENKVSVPGCKPKVLYHEANSNLLYEVPFVSKSVYFGKRLTIQFTQGRSFDKVFWHTNDAYVSSPSKAFFGLAPENTTENCQFSIWKYERIDTLKRSTDPCPYQVRFVDV